MNRQFSALVTCVLLSVPSATVLAQPESLVHYENHATRIYQPTPWTGLGFWDGKWRIRGTTQADHVYVYEVEVGPSEDELNEEYERFLFEVRNGERLTSRTEVGTIIRPLKSDPVIELVVEFYNEGGEIIYEDRELKSEVSLLVINTGSKDDIIDVYTDVPCWINSGDGYDLVYGGEGDDYIENPRAGGKSYGRGGNDILVGNTTGGGFFGTGVFLFGGAGVDTYITNFSDWIEDSMHGLFYSWGADITPMDMTYNDGHFAGMSQVALDEEFFEEYGW